MTATETPITLDTVIKEWEKDSDIDTLDCSGEIKRTPKLLQKYQIFWLAFSSKVKAHEQSLTTVTRELTDFYMGRTDQPSEVRIVKTEIQVYLKAHPNYQAVERKLESAKMALAYVDRILRHLDFRNNAIRTIADWEMRMSERGGR